MTDRTEAMGVIDAEKIQDVSEDVSHEGRNMVRMEG